MSEEPRHLDVRLERADLEKLRDKYQTLGEVRRAEQRGEPYPPNEFYRAMARLFPGALRELDQLALEEIDRRRDDLERALESGEVPRWARLVHVGHGFLRAAIHARALLRKDSPDHLAIALEVSEVATFPIAPKWIAILADRGACRLVPLSRTFLVEELGATETEVDLALARPPSRRRAT